MLDNLEDIDTTSQSHIHNALQRAILYEKCHKDENVCAVSNLEMNSLSAIIQNNTQLQKIMQNAKRKTRVSSETVHRPKIVRTSSTRNKTFGPNSTKWVKHKHKRNRENIVTSADKISLEPHVVSPFYEKNKYMQSVPLFPNQKLNGAKNISKPFLPDINQSKRGGVYQHPRSKRNKLSGITRIDVTLPSIFDHNSESKENLQNLLSDDHFENQENFHEVVKAILRKTNHTLPLPGKKINLSHIYRAFADKNYTPINQNEWHMQRRKQIHHDAIASYYDKKEKFENHSIFIIQLPSPEESLDEENSIRTSPKFFIRFVNFYNFPYFNTK